MSKIRVYRNQLKTAYIGRPPSIPKIVPMTACPPIAPGGKPFFMAPGDEFHDDRGLCEMMRNSSNNFTLLLYGAPNDVEADMAALGHPRVLEGEPFTVPDHNGKIARVVVGIAKALEEVTSEFSAALATSGNRVAAAKELAALTEKNEEQASVIAALQAEIEKLKRGNAKEEKKAAAVSRTVSAITGG